MNRGHILLASSSPRRKALLELVGFSVTAFAPDIDEDVEMPTPFDLALLLARQKAEAGLELLDSWPSDAKALIAADTLVWTEDEEILGKPKDRDDARRMLQLLSGTSHNVTTGYAIADKSGVLVNRVVMTAVQFFPLTEAEIEAYIATDEPFDKAGAYGIQGLGAALVSSIDGCYSNVVGLPVAHVLRDL